MKRSRKLESEGTTTIFWKVDYDIGMRTQLKNDVGDLLNSVRGAILVGDE